MNLSYPFIFNTETNVSADMDGSNINVDFNFFATDEASKLSAGPGDDSDKSSTSKKKKPKQLKISVNGEVMPERPIANDSVGDVDYARTYAETNNIIRGAIIQADELSSEIKEDIEAVRSSKTLKNKYTYLTNLTASASSLINTKIAAVKELNSTITQAHNLELNRLKALKINEKAENDDMRMMDLYSSFVNTPIGSYTPTAPTIQDITLGVNGVNPSVNSVEMTYTGGSNSALTPEQNRMRMESNPNIQVVVRYNQETGVRYFDVIDRTNGMSIPNYPRPDNFLLEDTTIDIHTGIARNRNINTVWPLVIDGSNSPIGEY